MRESRKQEQKRKIHQIISKAGRVHVICARKERSNAQQEQGGGGGKRKYLAANCSSRVRKGILEEVREVYTARQLRLQEEPSGQRDVRFWVVVVEVLWKHDQGSTRQQVE